MRQKIILLLFIAITAINNSFYGQTSTLQELNFLDSNDDLKEQVLQHKQKYQIKIININRNIYKIESSTKEISLNGTPPSVFSGIKVPAFINTTSSGLGFAASPVIHNLQFFMNKGEIDTTFSNENMKILFNEFSDFAKIFNNAILLNNGFINLINDCEHSFKTINDDATEAIKNHLNIVGNYNHNQLKQRIKTFLEEQLTQAQGLYQLIEQVRIIALEMGDDTSPEITDYLKNAEEAMKSMNEFETDNKLAILLNNYDKLSESYFIYLTKTIQSKKDEMEINIDITSDKLNCIRNVPVNYNNNYKVAGGWKIDFSTGVFFNAGSKDFLGRDLEYLPDGSDSMVTIHDKNENNRLMISLGGFAHIYKRTGKSVALAISPGVSTTLGLDAVNLHLGGSLMIGRKNRGIITVGATFKESTTLGGAYSYEQSYMKKLLPDAAPSTKKFPLTGWFVAFTYNISKFQKE